MLQGPRPGDPGTQVIPSSSNYASQQRPSAIRSQSYNNMATGMPSAYTHNSNSDTQLMDGRAGVLLPQNALMSMMHGQMPGGMPQIPSGMHQQIPAAMHQQIPAAMHQQIPAAMHQQMPAAMHQQMPAAMHQQMRAPTNMPGQQAMNMPPISANMPNIAQFGDVKNPYNMLLAPNLRTSVDSPLPKSGMPPLMNVDISQSNFLKAMNFDSLSNRATGSGENGQMMGEQDDDYSQCSQSEDGDYMEQSLVSATTADLMEHHQAKAQAQLLGRFKQLREWQASQQEILVQQQQQQMAQLRDEQTRVQRIIVKQRENQWGANGLAPSGPKISSSSPPRPMQNKPPLHPHSTLPQALPPGTLNLARVTRANQYDVEPIPQPTTPQKGRPVPIIGSAPSTPLEYLEYGNPALDSDNNTLASGTPLEEGIQRLADTASECSEAPGVGPAYFHSNSQPDITEDEREKRSHSAKKFGPPIPFPHVEKRERHSNSGVIPMQLIAPQLQQMTQNHMMGLPKVPNSGQPMFVRNKTPQFHQDGLHQNPHIVSNFRQVAPPGGQPTTMNNGVLDFRDEDVEMVNGGMEESDIQSVGNSEGFNVHDEDYQTGEVMYGEEDSTEEQSESPEFEQEYISESQSDPGEDEPLDLEDQPVGGTRKTFEQLLEEELQKEEARLREQEGSVNPTKKKTFLKRGEGLARFDNRPRRPPAKKASSKPVTKQSQPEAAPKISATKNTSQRNNKKVSASKKKTPVVSAKISPQAKLSLNAPPSQKSLSPQKPIVNSGVKQAQSQVATNQSSAPPPGPSEPTKKPGDSTGEMSFQICMQQRENHEEEETDQLEEFEILEQYADDNASFLSNMSSVNKVISHDKSKKPSSEGIPHVRTVQSQQPQFTAAPQRKGPATVAVVSDDSDTDDDDNHNDTLIEYSSDKHSDHDEHHPGSYQEDGSNSHMAALRTLQRKVSSMGNRSPQKILPNNERDQIIGNSNSESDTWDEFEGPNQVIASCDSDQSESSTEEEEESENDDDFDVKDIILNSKLHDRYSQKDSIPPSDMPSNMSASKYSNVAQNSDSNSSPPQRSASSSQQHGVSPDDFGDNEEWGDQAGQRSNSQKVIPAANGPIVKTKVFTEEMGSGDATEVTTTPPTSKLVSKLFPKLKPDQPKAPPITVQQEQQLTNVRQAALGDGVQSTALRDKLAELEKEISRFRKENANLESLRREREEGLQHIRKEMDEFQKQKAEELHNLQEFKNEEIKKLKKEKRVFEQYQKAARAMPDKRDREEIETLKKQVSDLQDELKRKEQRWTASSTRLRDRIESVEQENTELKEEIKVLEKKRLEAWQQKEAATAVSTAAAKREDAQRLMTSPQPQISHLPGQTSQPTCNSHIKHNDVIRLSYNTDGDNESDLPDSASQAMINLNQTNDESLIMQTAPQAMTLDPGKILSSSPQQNGVSEPLMARSGSSGSRSTLPRKTAVPANISRAIDKGDEKYEEMQHADGKIERIYSNGAREILFSNGTRKQVSSDGQSIIVSFFNGDIKQIMPDQRVVYYYADAQTTHTTYPDGLEIIQFPNSQTEKHYPDGTREITFPDEIIKYLFPTGVEESIFPDGTVIRVERNGDKVMEFPNGQREIHTPQYKRREYPDGTVKTVYPDGRQETRYSSGRIRVKDRDGHIIVDRRM